MARNIPLERIGQLMQLVLTELKEAGGQLRLRDLLDRVEKKMVFSEYEKAPYPKSGYIRWRALVHFFTL